MWLILVLPGWHSSAWAVNILYLRWRRCFDRQPAVSTAALPQLRLPILARSAALHPLFPPAAATRKPTENCRCQQEAPPSTGSKIHLKRPKKEKTLKVLLFFSAGSVSYVTFMLDDLSTWIPEGHICRWSCSVQGDRTDANGLEPRRDLKRALAQKNWAVPFLHMLIKDLVILYFSAEIVRRWRLEEKSICYYPKPDLCAQLGLLRFPRGFRFVCWATWWWVTGSRETRTIGLLTKRMEDCVGDRTCTGPSLRFKDGFSNLMWMTSFLPSFPPVLGHLFMEGLFSFPNIKIFAWLLNCPP